MITETAPQLPARGSSSSSLLLTSIATETSIEKIRKSLFSGKLEVSAASASAYDTAWVAMVPLREDESRPCFPQCVDWIVENQNRDGSWGHYDHPSLVKDSLSCTLACLLALRKWNLGHQLVHKGLDFIGSNGWAVSGKDPYSPMGFEIVFPHMVSTGNELGLNLPLDPRLVDSMLRERDMLLKRSGNLGYVAEGLGESCNWSKILIQQRHNGSLFNSPATTAAALIHSHDNKCFEYLLSVLNVFNRCVPSSYPADICTKLRIVDTLERLGIDRHFQCELDSIIDETYRLWQQKDEEIFADINCLSMSFRLLRMKGYDVSSDELAEFVDQNHFLGSVSLQFKGVATILELYRASHLRMYQKEDVLEKINSWTSRFLKQQLLDQTILNRKLHKQVESELSLEGTSNLFENIRCIKLYDADHFQMLKTAYRCPATNNEDILVLSQSNLSSCQTQFREEFHLLKRWYKDSKLSSIKCERNMFITSYVLAVLVLSDPQLSEARLWCAKSGILVLMLDDYFDCYTTVEEARNFTESIRRWIKKPAAHLSQDGEILLTAIHSTVNELIEKGSAEQGRCIKDFIISMWIEMTSCYMKEKESSSGSNKKTTLEEYLSISWVSGGCRFLCCMGVHFLGVKVSEDILSSVEFTSMLKHTCMISRLLNDINGFKREREEGKMSSVSLLLDDGFTLEEAITKLKQMIKYHRREVLQLHNNNVKAKGSLQVPKECWSMLWKAYQACCYMYIGDDRFTSQQQVIKDLSSVLLEPPATP